MIGGGTTDDDAIILPQTNYSSQSKLCIAHMQMQNGVIFCEFSNCHMLNEFSNLVNSYFWLDTKEGCGGATTPPFKNFFVAKMQKLLYWQIFELNICLEILIVSQYFGCGMVPRL